MNDQSFRPVAPDDQAIERHLDVLFGYLEGLAPIRLFSEAGTAKGPSKTPFVPVGPRLPQVVQRLAARAPSSGYGVFVVPGVVATEGSAGADDVVASGVLLADLDHGDIAAKRAYLERHIGAASLVVASGGITDEGQDKLHLYWRLTEAAAGEDLRTLTRLRGIVAQRAGGDASFDSIHQPIRVAGTIHGKHGVQRLVRILEDLPLEYELADLIERIEDMPGDPGSAQSGLGQRRVRLGRAGHRRSDDIPHPRRGPRPRDPLLGADPDHRALDQAGTASARDARSGMGGGAGPQCGADRPALAHGSAPSRVPRPAARRYRPQRADALRRRAAGHRAASR